MKDEGGRMKNEKEKPNDPYWDAVQEQWDNILTCYLMFADKKPIMLYDIQEQRIYTYPYQEFKADLSQKSQMSLTGQYQRAIKNNQIVVFVRDNEKEKLVSYTVRMDKLEGAAR
jgi:hypothetical protein